jgi:hypothetical protein
MKPPINYLRVANYVAGLCEIARSKGIYLEECHNFDELTFLNGCLKGKLELTPMFEPRSSELTPENAFWIKGSDEKGEVVHVQAARKYDLSGISLAQFMESRRAFYSDPHRGGKANENCVSAASMAHRITGTVCYHGEMWLKDGHEGYRGQGLSAVLPRMVMALALAKWAPDYIYGLAWDGIVRKGVALQYGYHNAEQHGVLWNLPLDPEPFDGWLIWLSRRELIDLITPP